MATKKQKRQEVEARRQYRLAEEQETGLAALNKDREHRTEKKRKAQSEKHGKEHSWKKIDRDCLFCQDLLKAQRQQEKAAMEEPVKENTRD